MITDFEALILGVVQGLTEFLPISSSGHLVLAQYFFGMTEAPLLYDVLLHLATFLATIAVLRKEVWHLIQATLRLPRFVTHFKREGRNAVSQDPYAWIVILILFSTLVTGTIGIFARDHIAEAFTSIRVAGFGLLFTGFVLFLSRRSSAKRTREETGIKDALWIGFAQSIALLPGVSRSGSTIGAGLFLGLERKFAGEYAFLVSLPAIFGAMILEGRHGFGNMPTSYIGLAAGFTAAFVAGALSLKLLLAWIRSGKLFWFAFYCWCVGALTLWLSFRS